VATKESMELEKRNLVQKLIINTLTNYI